MPVDRVLAHDEPICDLPVRQTLSEEAEDLALASRDARDGRLAPGCIQKPGGSRRLDLRAEPVERIGGRGRLLHRFVRAAQCQQARRELDSRLPSLEGSPARLEGVDGVLEQGPCALVVASGGLEHAGGEIDRRMESGSADRALEPAKLLHSIRCLRELAAREPSADEEVESRNAGELPARGRLPKHPLDEPTALSVSPASSESRARQSCAAGEGPARSSRSPASSALPCRLLTSASPIRGAGVHAGRDRVKSSSPSSSIRSASRHLPRQRSIVPYSVLQNASMYRLP